VERINLKDRQFGCVGQVPNWCWVVTLFPKFSPAETRQNMIPSIPSPPTCQPSTYSTRHGALVARRPFTERIAEILSSPLTCALKAHKGSLESALDCPGLAASHLTGRESTRGHPRFVARSQSESWLRPVASLLPSLRTGEHYRNQWVRHGPITSSTREVQRCFDLWSACTCSIDGQLPHVTGKVKANNRHQAFGRCRRSFI
jgi:hypothetical protein